MRAVFFVLLAAAAPFGAVAAESGPGAHATPAAVYQCPMHPWIKADHAGRCTVCGMDLVAALPAAGNTAEPGVVALSPSSITAIGVETTLVTRQPLVRTLRVTGRIDDDDTRHRILAARVPGRIEKLGINYLGAEVAAGATLATIYSPEMLTAQRVYLERLKAGGAAYSAADLAAAREQLQLLGLTADDIARLEESRTPSALVTVRAPGAGTVVSKFVYEGQYVQTSDRLFEIGDLTHMWFLFDAYEQDVPWLHVGQQLEITTRAVPGEVIHTTIEFIDPNFSETSRTTKVRAALPNPHYSVGGVPHRIPHRALAEARVLIESDSVLTAPRSAVLDTGLGPIAYVAAGGGRYEQRALRLGRRGDALVEVLGGLGENEPVVTTGSLLLDAQAQLSREAQRQEPAQPRTPPAPAAGSRTAPDDKFSVLATAAIEAAAALAGDDFARYQKIFPSLATAAAPFAPLPPLPPADSIKAARRSFEPWSTAVADLLKPQRSALGLKIFQCPMAPVLGKGRWVQRSQPLRNPFFGSAMANCGEELP